MNPGIGSTSSARRWAVVTVASLCIGGVVACGGNPPQIVDYSPERGATNVSTGAPIRITFDHDVEKASVESRLHLDPATAGNVHWVSPRQLAYEHPTLKPSTNYQVVLEGGYRDLAGNTYTLRHHWAFVTEAPPNLAGSTPGDTDTGVDPAAYLTLDFTREMNASTLASAITITPTVPFAVRLDPADGRRAVIAPAQLLEPSTTYTIAVATVAQDADGNQLERAQSLRFTTGSVRPLRHWVAFTADTGNAIAGGLWIVNESSFPRQLVDSTSIQSFSWSPEGDRLVVQGDGESWSAITPGAGSVALGFRGAWAAALGSGLGYVSIDDGSVLHRWSDSGTDTVIATDVSQAAVAPNGERIAFVQAAVTSSTIWGYDVGLQARYLLASEDGPLASLSWSPAGNRLAYLRDDAGTMSLRVRNLTGLATTTTVASGDLGAPSWLPDSTHLLFAAAVASPNGQSHKAFVVNVVAPPAALTAALGLPSDQTIDVSNPVPSPDGHQIAFVNGNQIWLMNGDGTRPTPLTAFDPTSFPYSCRTPAWTRS
jgi:Big-like domain-containing protein